MVVEARVAAAAERFWALAGVPPAAPYPREPVEAIRWAAPLAVVAVGGLSVAGAERWLRQRANPYRFPCANRALRGCLLAYRGHGLVFVDADDPADERRFTLAHEVAHFLLDYQAPRQQALAALGPTIQAVLDGERAPTQTERVHALLATVPLKPHWHLLDRSEEGRIKQAGIQAAEDQADRLARELLAPEEQARAAVRAILARESGDLAQRRAAASELAARFGLPRREASLYAGRLLHELRPGPSFGDWLGGGSAARS